MNASSTPPQVTIPQRTKESKDDEEEGDDPVKGLSPKMKIAQMLFDFGVWAYPQGHTPVNAEIRDFPQEEPLAPLLSSPGPCTTLVDEHVASLTTLMPDQDLTSIKADNRGLDDVLFLDGMETVSYTHLTLPTKRIV